MPKNSESGYVVLVVAALLFVLVGFTAVAVDMGVLLGARTQSQRAADAAALAGAFTFILNPSSQPATAQAHALETATRNMVLGQSISPGDITVNVNVPNKQVTVNIRRHEATFFADVFNMSGVDVVVQATAEAGVNATGATCVKPFFIPNTILSPKDPCDATASGELLVSGGQVTPYARSKFGVQLPVPIHSNNTEQALAPGDFYEIDIDGGGGSAYKENISSCNTTQLACRSSYDVLTGTKTGPTDQGVVALIGDPPRDTFVAVGRYQTPNGIRDMSKALVVAPVMDLATESVPPWGLGGFCPPPVGACMAPNPGKKCKQFPSGSNQKVSVKVVGFAMVFLDSTAGGNVQGRVINVTPCGSEPPSGDDSNGADYAVPLRLVRLP